MTDNTIFSYTLSSMIRPGNRSIVWNYFWSECIVFCYKKFKSVINDAVKL